MNAFFGHSNISPEVMHPFGCKVSYLLSAPKRGGPSKLEPLTQDGVYLVFQLDKVIDHVIYDPIENDTLTIPHTSTITSKVLTIPILLTNYSWNLLLTKHLFNNHQSVLFTALLSIPIYQLSIFQFLGIQQCAK